MQEDGQRLQGVLRQRGSLDGEGREARQKAHEDADQLAEGEDEEWQLPGAGQFDRVNALL